MGNYRELPPPPALSDFVECFWTREPTIGESGRHRVLPDGCSDVIFTLDGRGAGATAVGTMTRPIVVADVSSRSYVGVRFRPGKATLFLGVPATDLTDIDVPLADLWSDAGGAIARFEDAANDRERIEIVSGVLLARLRRTSRASISVDEALRRIVASAGNLSIGSLASVIGVSRQHLAKCFAHEVGVSPKTFARVVRLRRALQRVREVPDPDWAALALECGYYDQSHLISEFREITGLTPEGWVAD
jgi:AraC-like DNA-binding protein